MRMVLEGARVWDGEDAAPSRSPLRIWIERGEISSVGTDPGGEGWRVVTLPVGSVAIPGLIDAHVHLDLDPALMKPDDQFAVPREERDLRMVARAREMARAGITTARDLGAGEWRELALRDAIERGDLPGPRLLCAGQPVTVPDGHCHFWGGAAVDAAAQAEVVQRQIEVGVDWIKVMATGGVFTAGSSIDRAQFSEAEIAAIVRQATTAGRPVAAHCHGAAGIRHAARAGVRTIEHCSFAGPGGFGSAFDPVAISDLASHGTWVSPTVNEGWRHRTEKEGRPTAFHQRMRFVFAALREASVPLVASTDAGIPGVRHDRLAFALPAFADFAQLSARDTLRSATSDAAKALGLERTCGVLCAGRSADVLVLRDDPFENLGVLEEPLFVVARGRVMRDELGVGGSG
jgi:imidazolonepropionase-like amidohydrolase